MNIISRFCQVGCDWVLVVQASHSIRLFVGIAYPRQGYYLLFRFIIEYSKLKGFWPLSNNNRSIYFYMRIFLR
jgi:hypothetical protein